MKRIWLMCGIAILLFLVGCSASTGGGANSTGSGTNPVPMITAISPTSAPAGSATGFALTINGKNFAAGTTISFGGTTPTPTFVSTTQLVASIPAAALASAGPVAVTVTNPTPGSTSNAVNFIITSGTSGTCAGGVNPQSITVDPTGKFAYVANEGCSDTVDGSVSMYTINPTDGTLTSAGPPVTSGDVGADSVAVDPSGKFVYVANWGDGDTAGSVSMYAINGTTGILTPTGTIGAPCAPPPSPGGCAPWSLAVHPSGKFVYVANEGGFTPTSVSMYAIDANTGVLGLIGTVAVFGRAAAVAVDPSGKFAYVADGGQSSNGAKGTNVAMYSIDATTGVLTSIGTAAAGLSPSSIAIHPSGKFVYVVNNDSNDISTYTLNLTTGNLASIGTVAATAGSIVIHPSGKFAYVTSSGGVAMYTIDTTTGALTFAGTTASGSTPNSITIHPSGKFAYGTNSVSNNVSMYSVDTSAGSLTLIGTI
jgi:6-phosphogluconolactonase (cycloisomerase 2 family)